MAAGGWNRLNPHSVVMHAPFDAEGGFQAYLASGRSGFRRACRRCLGHFPSICGSQIGRMGILGPLHWRPLSFALATIDYKDNAQPQRPDDPLCRRLLSGENFTDRCSMYAGLRRPCADASGALYLGTKQRNSTLDLQLAHSSNPSDRKFSLHHRHTHAPPQGTAFLSCPVSATFGYGRFSQSTGYASEAEIGLWYGLKIL